MHVFLLVLLGVAGVVGHGEGLHQWTAKHIETALRVHNERRCAHSSKPASTIVMGWSESAADVARCWVKVMARTGNFAHSPSSGGECNRNGRGENLAAAWGHAFSSDEDLDNQIVQRIQSWYDEQKYYNAGSPSFTAHPNFAGKAVGHFTQMVWDGSKSLGCATAGKGTQLFLSCNYVEGGNMMGAFAQNIHCKNSAGAGCEEWRSPSSAECDVGQFYDAGAITWSTQRGTSKSNAVGVRKGAHVDMVSPHATTVCHLLSHSPSGTPPSGEPQCDGSVGKCVRGGHEDYVFLKDDEGKDLMTDDVVVIKVRGCAVAPHENGPVAIGYFKILKPVQSGKPVHTPAGGATIPMNSHVKGVSSGAEKVCWTIDGSTPKCSQSSMCSDGDMFDVVVDHDETLQSIGCVTGAADSPVTSGQYTIEKEVVEHKCDETLTGPWSGYLDWYCGQRCGMYLMVNHNCMGLSANGYSSEAAALAANPGMFIFAHDGARCTEFSRTPKCVPTKGGAAGDAGSEAAPSGGWTTATTVVLVVGLVATVALFAVGVLVGKKMGAPKREAPQASQFESLAEEQEL